MEKNSRICKICNKSFSNGKAMGGHMRSHLVKHPITPKPQFITPKSPTPPSYSYSSSSSSSLNNSSKTHEYFQGRFTLNREVGSQDWVIHDKVVDSTAEIDSNPNNNFTRRRSERRRKAIKRATLIETDQVSSILSNDTFSQVEEVAKCLIMLSRDTWEKRNDNVSRNKLVDEEEEEEEEEYELVSNKSRIRVRTITKSNRYKCDTCNRVFKSYQALGGHRASHKKTTNQSFENESDDQEGVGSSFNNVIELKKTFECPFCFKVFGSGQALGGHKKVHFSNVTINSRINNISSAKLTDHNLIIDLNLPAPQEDEEMKTT